MLPVKSVLKSYTLNFSSKFDEIAPAKTEEYPSRYSPSDILQFPKLQGFTFAVRINIRMEKLFAFAREK